MGGTSSSAPLPLAQWVAPLPLAPLHLTPLCRPLKECHPLPERLLRVGVRTELFRVRSDEEILTRNELMSGLADSKVEVRSIGIHKRRRKIHVDSSSVASLPGSALDGEARTTRAALVEETIPGSD